MVAEMTLPVPLCLQAEEHEVIGPRDRLTVSQWAERYRILSRKTTDLDGPWSHEYTPFLIDIMDWLSSPGTRQVTLVKCGQAGGTEAGLNFLGWVAEESPAPFLLVMPREDDANRRVGTRIRPMFEATPSLLRHLDGKPENLNIGKETVLNTMILYLAWATSPAALADNPICYIVLDEVGKFPLKSGKEADPVSLAKDRQRTFFSRSKLFVLSTPVEEGDLIDREHRRGDRCEWWVPCPHCGDYHVLRWENVDLDKTSDKKLLTEEEYLAGGHARYVCPACEKSWSEQDRWAAVSAGMWVPDGCTVEKNGRIVGKQPVTTHRSARITALMLHPHFMTTDRLAAKWADAQYHYRTGDVGPLQDFVNSELAEPWRDAENATDEETLAKHAGAYPGGTVPDGVILLTAAADVQQDHFWVVVMGWGYMSQCWMIYADRIESGDTSKLCNWELLGDFFAMTWPRIDANGEVTDMPVRLCVVDSAYQTDVAYDFCRQRGGVVIPIRGDDSVRGMWTTTKLDRNRHTGKLSGARLVLYRFNPTAYKDRMARLMGATEPGPGYLRLPADTTGEILRQMTSEEKRLTSTSRRGKKVARWVLRPGRRQNHIWDASIYATVTADLVGARSIRDPDSPPIKQYRRRGVMERYRK